MSKQNNLVLENAKIILRNFSGKAGRFNPAGNRNFCVLIDRELADVLMRDGWNVKWFKSRDEDEEDQAFIKVTVNYANIPPKILLITSRGKTLLTEENVDMLDWAEIENVDLIINPYHWEVNDAKGVKAYLKSMYITIVEDEFEHKYADIPLSTEADYIEDNTDLPTDLPFEL